MTPARAVSARPAGVAQSGCNVAPNLPAPELGDGLGYQAVRHAGIPDQSGRESGVMRAIEQFGAQYKPRANPRFPPWRGVVAAGSVLRYWALFHGVKVHPRGLDCQLTGRNSCRAKIPSGSACCMLQTHLRPSCR